MREWMADIYEQGGEYVDFATGEWNIQTDDKDCASWSDEDQSARY